MKEQNTFNIHAEKQYLRQSYVSANSYGTCQISDTLYAPHMAMCINKTLDISYDMSRIVFIT